MSDSDTIPTIHTDPEPAVRHIGTPPGSYQPHATTASDATDERERQRAFDSEFQWHGKKLLPWSSSRDSLFSQQRVAMGAPSLSACLEDTDAFVADAHRILWLCTHKPEDWSILRVSPAALQAAIDTWADEHIPIREAYLASTLALEIYFSSRRNQHETAPQREGHGDDLGN